MRPQIANLPKNATLDKITTLFSGPSGAFKGIWAGKLAAHGVLVIIYFNIKEAELAPPGWLDQARVRAEDILDRELKIAEREREISRREEAVNRREHDASRRENWIMEQLVYVFYHCMLFRS